MSEHPWMLEIYQAEGTVLVPARIFVNKVNTHRLKDETYGPRANLSIVSRILRVLNSR